MSVQQKQYLIIGVKLPYEYFDSNSLYLASGKDDVFEYLEQYDISNYDKKINHIDNLAVLFDGMNGKYIIIGNVVAMASDCEYDYAIEYIDIEESIEKSKDIYNLVSDSLKRNFGIEDNPKMHLITHYS